MTTLSIEDIGRVCHEANRAFQTSLADPAIPVSPPWDEETDDYRNSTISGVQGALAGATPQESHEAWMRSRIEAGWTLGPKKDVERKEHHLLVPYADLSPQDRAKDALFLAVVGALRSLHDGG